MELLADRGRGGGKKSSPPKICHTHPTMMKLGTVIPCLKKSLKIYESRDTPLVFCCHQHFVIKNQQILLYQKLQIKIPFWHIISTFLKFFCESKHYFNKHGYNNVSKIGFSSASEIKNISK